MTGVDGRDVISTGAGNDTIDVVDGRKDIVNCGPGIDTVRADHADVLRHCEHVTR